MNLSNPLRYQRTNATDTKRMVPKHHIKSNVFCGTAFLLPVISYTLQEVARKQKEKETAFQNLVEMTVKWGIALLSFFLHF